MAGSLSRRGITEYAARIGFGRVARVHWQYRDSVLAGVLSALTIVALLGVVVIAFFQGISGAPHWWRLPVLAWTALLGVTYVCWRWGPVRDPDDRLRVVATEGGLLLWRPGAAEPPTAVAWPEVRVAPQVVPPGIVWSDGAETHELNVASFARRSDLIWAVRQGAPVPRWPIGRVAAVGGVGLAFALVLGFAAVPVALDIVFGERPNHITDLARMCDGGDAFGRAVPYQGPPPHPVAVYDSHADHFAYVAGLDTRWPPPPDDVQLVGCLRLTGRASPDELKSCDYQGGLQDRVYQGRYRLDILEVRTGRRLASIPMDGTTETDGCGQLAWVKPGVTYRETNTQPDDAAYALALSALVNGEAGG